MKRLKKQGYKMALYEFNKDSIIELPSSSYSMLGLREREDVQRVLRENIEVISPDTMILAEEFGDWADSRRRIDLLGLDREGHLVVIELKRTEDGGHMDLQALGYAAMVSTLKFEQAVQAYRKYLASRNLDPDGAENCIRKFLGVEQGLIAFSNQVKIVLASADFSKEVTSSVLWLNSQGLDITCVRMRPYSFKDRVLLDVQQVIPLPEAAAYQILIREKSQIQEIIIEEDKRDYTRYHLSFSDGREFDNLPKRRFIYNIVKEALRLGLKTASIIEAVPWKSGNFFISAQGKVSGKKLLEENPRKDERRYFCDDSELFFIDGITYAMTNQWGARTVEAVESIIQRLPEDHGIAFEAMS